MIGLAGSGYEADDRQGAVGLQLVLCEAGAAVVICCYALSRSVPCGCSAVTAIVRPSISTVTSSGCAAML